VHDTNVKKNLTPDLVLAKFDDEKDKVYIMESIINASRCKETLLQTLANYMIFQHQNPNVKQLTKTEIKEWTRITNEVFNLFMLRIQSLSLLNRNKDGNNLVQMLTSGAAQMALNIDDTEPNIGTEQGMLNSLKKKLRNEDKRNQELE